MGVVYRPTASSELNITTTVSTPEYDEMLVLYIQKSINRHFSGANSYPLYFEGDERDHINEEPIRVELRIDGPFISQFQKGMKQYYYEINALITVNFNFVEIYRMAQCIAYVVKFFCSRIPLFDSDGNNLGCLTYHKDRRREMVEVNQYGEIREDTRIEQATIEAHYVFVHSTL